MENIIADSHIHLNSTSVFHEIPTKNVGWCLNINTSIEEFLNIKNERVFQALAVVPQESENKIKHIETLKFIDETLSKDKFAINAIGETGLDAPFRNVEHFNIQKEVFIDYLKIAKKYRKPVIVHCRDCFDELISILSNFSLNMRYPGIIHCFTGTLRNALDLIEMGWKISISGIVTFKKSNELRDVVKNISIDSILVETDAPYLAPHPFRGRENYPDLIIHTINTIAELKNMKVENVIEKTRKNLFSVLDLS